MALYENRVYPPKRQLFCDTVLICFNMFPLDSGASGEKWWWTAHVGRVLISPKPAPMLEVDPLVDLGVEKKHLGLVGFKPQKSANCQKSPQLNFKKPRFSRDSQASLPTAGGSQQSFLWRWLASSWFFVDPNAMGEPSPGPVWACHMAWSYQLSIYPNIQWIIVT